MRMGTGALSNLCIWKLEYNKGCSDAYELALHLHHLKSLFHLILYYVIRYLVLSCLDMVSGHK